ncbi:DUF6676 family protein [Tomitella cavernea]|uniref:TPM domain-containing protein n=1 Tax=Tomitella cavernea TaxID=1387982 RepID=A0ABP9CPP7_9ACTN
MSSADYASETLAGMNVQQVIRDVAHGGVSVPPEYTDVAPGLRAVVTDAQQEGLELSVVVVPHDQWGMKLGSAIAYPERLRDLSTAVGESEGGTVLTLGPAQIGTYSDSLSRFTLESAENAVQHPRSPELTVAAQRFVDEVGQDQFPWTAVSAVLLVLVVIVVVGGTVLNVRRARG